MDKLEKFAKRKKKICKTKAKAMTESVSNMQKTLKTLINEVNTMECKSISEQLNAIIARINAVENNFHDKNDIIQEAASLIYESEMKLQSLTNDLKSNQFIRKKEMEDALEWSNWTMVAACIMSAILGGSIVVLAV